MREIKIDELKVIQMDILSAIQRFCISHGIRYSMGCGTMLGCARHKGYIPWDDDIDIYMLRSDYNKLVKEFPDVYEGQYRFVTLERDKKWDRAYGKAYNCRTLMKESANTSYDLGVNIDVFPIDNVPDNEEEWLAYNKKRRFLQRVYEMKILSFRRGRSLQKNAFLAFCKLLLLPISSRYIAKKIQKMALQFDNMPTSRVFECCQGLLQKKPFKKALFDDIIMMPFEDREFMAFADYDSYLTNGFGNWHELPPKEKQVSHHAFKAWWES